MMVSLLYLLTICCTLSAVWCGCPGKFNVTLYERKNYGGMYSLIEGNTCKTVDSKLDNKVSSIKIESGCVQVYEDVACQEYLETYSTDENTGYLSTMNLKGTDVQDAVSSVGACRCGGKYKVQLHEHKLLQGEQQVIESNKCENVNSKLIHKVSSLVAEYGCISVYRNPNCEKFMDKYSGDGKNGFIANNNLGLYGCMNDAILSVGPCY